MRDKRAVEYAWVAKFGQNAQGCHRPRPNMLPYTDYIKIFVGIVAVMNPVGAIPIFVNLTSSMGTRDRNAVIHIVILTVTTILLSALLFGESILEFFGISIHSFRVGGGILLLLMSVSMLHGRLSGTVQTKEEAVESQEKESIAVVPLSMPLLAGPGAISAVIIAAHRGAGAAHYGVIGVEILVLAVALWLALRLAPIIAARISSTAINVFTRIMGLMLAAIAVEFIANGLKGLFPALA